MIVCVTRFQFCAHTINMSLIILFNSYRHRFVLSRGGIISPNLLSIIWSSTTRPGRFPPWLHNWLMRLIVHLELAFNLDQHDASLVLARQRDRDTAQKDIVAPEPTNLPPLHEPLNASSPKKLSDTEAALDTQLERLSSSRSALSRTKDMTLWTKMPMLGLQSGWTEPMVQVTPTKRKLPMLMWSNSVRKKYRSAPFQPAACTADTSTWVR